MKFSTNTDRMQLQKYMKKVIDPSLKITDIQIPEKDESKLLRLNEAVVVECIVREETRKYVIRYPIAHNTGCYNVEQIKDYFWLASSKKSKSSPNFISLAYFSNKGDLKNLAGFQNIAIIEEYVYGDHYANILLRKSINDEMDKIDRLHASGIVNYLVNRHVMDDSSKRLRSHDALLLLNKAFSVLDRLSETKQMTNNERCHVEGKMLAWRHKLQMKNRKIVLSHNDFHPWNIIFPKSNELKVIDRDFPGYSNSARDLGTLIPSYIYFSLLTRNDFSGMCKETFCFILDKYMQLSGDSEIVEVIQPYFAMACFILSNKHWFPSLNDKQCDYIRELGKTSLDSNVLTQIEGISHFV